MTACCLAYEIAMKTSIFSWFLPLLLILFVLVGCNQRPSLRIGDRPQRIEISDMHGKKVDFPAAFKGQVAMVRFWSVSCPDCNKEIFKAMQRLYVKYQDRGFVAVSVNVKQPAEAAAGLERIDKLITYPVLLDPDATVAEFYGIKGFPTTFILDREGVVKEKVIGETGIELFESFLPPLLQ